MACSNQVVRFALSDANGVTGFSVSSKIEAGAAGLLARGSQQVGGVCTDYSGNIYVTDPSQHCIIKIDEGGRVSNFAGTPGTSGNNGVTKVANNSAEFNTPLGICCDKSNNLYVADSGNNMIRKISSGYVTNVAGSSAAASGFVDGVGSVARFNAPSGIAVDNAGIIYVADTDNNAVRKITMNGDVLTIFGNVSSGASGDEENVEANGQTAGLSAPKDVAVDAEGNVYVLDSGNNKIKKIVPRGWVYLFSGSGTAGTSLGTAGSTPATAQSFTCEYETLSMCDTDASGNLFVVDFAETATRLLKVNYNGVPAEVADFQGTAVVACPVAVAVSPGQKLFVTMSDYSEALATSSSSESSSSS